MRGKPQNANYDFSVKKKSPKEPLGQGEFANMPQEPIYKGFGSYNYQDGIINSMVDSLEKMSGIVENQR
jgi:hypothetical protein